LEDQRNIDDNDIFMNLNPKCEPNLEKRGLFNKVVHLDSGTVLSINWVLNLSDGRNSLSDISRISGIEYNLIKETSELLLKHNLLKKIT
jgi:aminopeptidase-like protein